MYYAENQALHSDIEAIERILRYLLLDLGVLKLFKPEK